MALENHAKIALFAGNYSLPVKRPCSNYEAMPWKESLAIRLLRSIPHKSPMLNPGRRYCYFARFFEFRGSYN
jgi:hypothetical protein